MPTTSIFRSLILSAVFASLVILSFLIVIMYQTTVAPLDQQASAEAMVVAEKELSLRLLSKEDSVLSVAASLARDPRVREGLRHQDHALAFSALNNLTEDYAAITPYQGIRAQVIRADTLILARSWDPDFQGQPAPHPLVKVALSERRSVASFGIGNAGVGIIGFAPVIEEGELLGLISVTQGVYSVVKSLREAGLEWTLLVDIAGLEQRFSGQIPPVYHANKRYGNDYLLAHETWFDLAHADRVIARMHPPSTTPQAYLIDNEIQFDLPVYDDSGQLIGRHLLTAQADSLNAKIDESRNALLTVTAIIVAIIILIVALLLMLVKQRIIQPIQYLADCINHILQAGEFSQRLKVKRHDELGNLLINFNRLLNSLQASLQESSSVIHAIAQGDFDRRMTGDYPGDLNALKLGINASALELQTSHQAMVKANLAKSQFLANMSHEIRTPINGVIGMLSLLQHSELDEHQAEQVRLAQSSAELLLGLVNDILDFSKIEAGKMTLEQAPVHLPQLLNNLKEIFNPAAQARKLELRLEIGPDLPSWILGDSLRLRQILNNLLSNALKFTEQGEICVRAHRLDQTLRLSVRDTGIGISSQTQERLFKSFAQADSSTSRKYGGTGLGLKISQELVKLMQGQMGLESKEGQGSEFWFSLPLRPCEAPIEKVESNGQTLYPGKRILLVEDNLVNQKLALKLLEKFAIQADLAQNGQEALEMAREGVYDLVLMDCQMPVMDGYTATRLLRQSDFRVPIAALTANATAEDRRLCIECGMNDFLAKPYHLKGLAELLARWLN
ncbi:ATP-binding protein [Nitrincola tapanii]|uniref:Sensory/regulatory protein RpfC n=1 Tax=Nitrincola tapanii TaxID=1708751 RepID=A0A5A9W1I4_9GAMM|nr:ATP-binding protein [Nitrincola tapanii]KAA0874650.1 response regulator [Nitrincola tapanii]